MAEEKKEFTTALSQWSNTVTGLVVKDFAENGVEFSPYAKECGLNAMSSIFQLCKTSNVSLNEIDTSNLREIVGQCASLKLNANGLPRECYFQLRKKKIGNDYVQTVELGLEGAGMESLLRNFGVGVEHVYDWWIIHEGDDFVFPHRKGLEMTPPEWSPKGLSQRAVRVVLPVKLKDGSVTYLMAERESTKVNLFAHVRNNLMNETFGICENRYKATAEQKAKIEDEKQKIYNALSACETVDDMLKCTFARPFMSGAWIETSESMIVRKMQNNAIRKFPKNFDNMSKQSILAIDETYQSAQSEIEENANSEPFVVDDIISEGETNE